VPGLVPPADFFPGALLFPDLPVDHLSVVDRKEDRTDVVPIPRLINLEEYLDYVTNGCCRTSGASGAGECVECFGVHGSRDHRPQLEITAAELECASCWQIDLAAGGQDSTSAHS